MRIAAGVMIILCGLWSGCLGAGMTVLGGAASAVGSAVGDAAEEAKSDAAAAGIDTDGADEASEAADDVAAAGALVMVVGVFLIVLFGIDIAAGVVLFRQKAAGFAKVAGILTIVVALALAYVSLGAGAAGLMTPLFFIVTGVLTILAAKGYADGGGEPAAPAAPPAT